MPRILTTGKTYLETFTKEDGTVITTKVPERHPVETARMKSLVNTLSYPKKSDGYKDCGCYDHPHIRYCKHQDPKEEAAKERAAAKARARKEQAWRDARNKATKGKKKGPRK